MFVILVLSSTYLFLINKSSNNIQKTDENIVSSVPIINHEKVVNISDCSEEFMESYFDDVAKLQESDNKENILIVTSLNGISDDFGASSVVEAPNNQYFLQYDSKEEKLFHKSIWY